MVFDYNKDANDFYRPLLASVHQSSGAAAASLNEATLRSKNYDSPRAAATPVQTNRRPGNCRLVVILSAPLRHRQRHTDLLLSVMLSRQNWCLSGASRKLIDGARRYNTLYAVRPYWQRPCPRGFLLSWRWRVGYTTKTAGSPATAYQSVFIATRLMNRNIALNNERDDTLPPSTSKPIAIS